jgi:saccharopine dehydrogenase-like NADP-dependent oxidoreductase
MEYVVLGYGKIGRTIVADISKYQSKKTISVYDPFVKGMKGLPANVKFYSSDPLSEENKPKIFREDVVIISALPAKLRKDLIKAVVKGKSKLVDITFGNDIIKDYLPKTNDQKFLIVPDCGLAPGISNFIVGKFASEFTDLENIEIYVGGLPNEPAPPLEYKITFASDSVIDEYVNPAKIVENGKIVVKEALSGLEDFPSEILGSPLEAFLTDGLRSLIDTIKSSKNMFEKTIRYKGHAEKVKLLRDIGFFDSRERRLNENEIVPRDLTEKLFDEKLKLPDIGDTIILKVRVSGIKNGRKLTDEANMVYRCEANPNYTGMSITTACPASIIAQMIGENMIDGQGLLTMEEIASKKGIFDEFIRRLSDRGIKVNVSENL